MIKLWVIYQRPTDYPDAPFVMREFYIPKGGRVTPTDKLQMGASIEELRANIPPGKMRMPRSEDDEQQIVEWYF